MTVSRTDVVVDTSALVAVVRREPTHLWLQQLLSSASSRVMAAPNAVELTIVLESRAPAGSAGVARRAIRDGQVEIISVDESLAERAADAWRRFGKGRHRAGLNFGDCFTYALAEETGYPILCVGEDFARTDLEVLRPLAP